MTGWIFVSLAAVAGGALAVQAAINAVLAGGAGHPFWAAAISNSIGLLALLLVGGLFRAPLPTLGAVSALPWWAWLGGAVGAVYVASSIVVIPKLGAATLVALVVTGQMLTSLALDHFGAFGLQEQGLTLWRAAGALLLIAGVVLIRQS